MDWAEEELAYRVARNLVRCVMTEAAPGQDARLDRLRFKGTLDALRQYTAAIAGHAHVSCGVNSGKTCC